MKVYTNIPTGSLVLKLISKHTNLKRVTWLRFPQIDSWVNRVSHKKAVELSNFFTDQGINFLVVETVCELEGNPDSKDLLLGDFTVEKKLLVVYNLKGFGFGNKKISVEKGLSYEASQRFKNMALTSFNMEEASHFLGEHLKEVFT